MRFVLKKLKTLCNLSFMEVSTKQLKIAPKHLMGCIFCPNGWKLLSENGCYKWEMSFEAICISNYRNGFEFSLFCGIVFISRNTYRVSDYCDIEKAFSHASLSVGLKS